MLRVLVSLLKLSVFTVAILIAGELVQWNGHTIGEHALIQVKKMGIQIQKNPIKRDLENWAVHWTSASPKKSKTEKSITSKDQENLKRLLESVD